MSIIRMYSNDNHLTLNGQLAFIKDKQYFVEKKSQKIFIVENELRRRELFMNNINEYFYDISMLRRKKINKLYDK